VIVVFRHLICYKVNVGVLSESSKSKSLNNNKSATAQKGHVMRKRKGKKEE